MYTYTFIDLYLRYPNLSTICFIMTNFLNHDYLNYLIFFYDLYKFHFIFLNILLLFKYEGTKWLSFS